MKRKNAILPNGVGMKRQAMPTIGGIAVDSRLGLYPEYRSNRRKLAAVAVQCEGKQRRR